VCRGCDADIVWAQVPSGKNLPFDAEPSVDGQWLLTGEGRNRRARHLRPEEISGRTDLHVPHMATCPCAEVFRRARRMRERVPQHQG
jgi:hypothetical protein